MRKLNKKAEGYGIDIVTEVALGLFILMLVIVAVIVGSFALLTYNVFPQVLGGTTATDSLKYVNNTGWPLSKQVEAGFSSPVITLVINATDGTTITATNYTIISNRVYNATAVEWPNATITYSYNRLINSNQYNQANGMVTNLTNASAGFFNSSSTFFGILIVVVIMIFLGLMIGAVMLFKGRNNSAVGK